MTDGKVIRMFSMNAIRIHLIPNLSLSIEECSMTEARPEFKPVLEGRAFIARRLTRPDPSREQAVWFALNVLARELSMTPRSAIDPWMPVELSEAGIAKWLARCDKSNERRESRLSQSYELTNDSPYGKVFFLWRKRPSGKGRPKFTEELECTIPHEITLEPLLSIFSQISVHFHADYSYVYNMVLRNLHGRAVRAYEQALAKSPPAEHHRILRPLPYEGVTDNLPLLLLSNEFDCLRVPDGILWVNYWSPLQVETVGIERIRTADWASLIEHENGGVTVAVTEAAFDVTNAAHMAKLGEIVEHLRLRELQEQYRIHRT
jgi:hypothetical protein